MSEFFIEEDFKDFPNASKIVIKANCLLRERGVLVTGSARGLLGTTTITKPFSDNTGLSDTHQALLINIEPIERDSAEKVLAEFVACCEVGDPKLRWGELVSRAKKLLEKK